MSLRKYLSLCEGSSDGSLLLEAGDFKSTSLTTTEGSEFQLALRVPRSLGAVSVSLAVYSDGNCNAVREYALDFCRLTHGFDEYGVKILANELRRGIYFLKFELKTDCGAFYAKRIFDKIVFTKEENKIQLTVSNFEFKSPSFALGGIIYHIFVDRFCRGEEVFVRDGGVLYDGEWDAIPEYPPYKGAPLKNNSFYGGSLDGVRKMLGHIASLGVNIIYLSPIFDSPSNHKYDTSDYMKVDSCFGGDEALKRLIEDAKKLGIRIILDGVFNHTGDDSIYFNRYGRFDTLGAYQSRSSEYFDWYEFEEFPTKYTCWWGIDILPRINPDKPSSREYFLGKDGVMDKYRKMGIYGMRLDVCDELSDDFISGIKRKLCEDGESYLVGEVWEDGSNKKAYGKRKSYYLGSELDGVMNYPLRTGMIEFLCLGKSEALRYALTELFDNCPHRIRNSLMNLLGSHDTERIITLLSGKRGEGRSNSELSRERLNEKEREIGERRILLAYTALATLPGIPSIFYGDEAGLEGYHDPFNRMPYPHGKENLKILDFFKKIGIIRRGNSIYRDGGFELRLLTNELLVFSRFDKTVALTTVINNSDNPVFIECEGNSSSLLDERVGPSLIIEGGEPAILQTVRGKKLRINRG